MTHIVATISGHGFGHLSITAPVLARLNECITGLKLTIISGLPRSRIESRLKQRFDYLYSSADFGMLMDDTLNVRVADTIRAYDSLHQQWPDTVQHYAQHLVSIQADLVISNISYLSISAGALAGIPTVALCPLNWADMYRHFCHPTARFTEIHDQINTAYNQSDCFLKPQPCMPMSGIASAYEVPPIAACGQDRREELRAQIARGHRLVALVALGGHDIGTIFHRLPEDNSIVWLVSKDWQLNQDNVVFLEHIGIPFLDLMASCDLIVAKPGYGTFTEAAVAGTPVLFVRRPEWPEQDYLIEWLQTRHNCIEHVPSNSRNDDSLLMSVTDLLSRPAKHRPIVGIDNAVDAIVAQLQPQ